MTDTSMTYIQFLLDERRREGGDRDLLTLLHSVATACKAISNSLKNGALADVLAQCLALPEPVMVDLHGETDVAERARKALAAHERFPARRRD